MDFEQWSVRPYQVGQGCDGTIECNMHLVVLTLMPALGIDYRRLYAEAYPCETLEGWPSPETSARLAAETTVPDPGADALERLLHDLFDTNHRTLEDELRSRLEALGHLTPTDVGAPPERSRRTGSRFLAVASANRRTASSPPQG
jgi:hypothetical protein